MLYKTLKEEVISLQLKIHLKNTKCYPNYKKLKEKKRLQSQKKKSKRDESNGDNPPGGEQESLFRETPSLVEGQALLSNEEVRQDSSGDPPRVLSQSNHTNNEAVNSDVSNSTEQSMNKTDERICDKVDEVPTKVIKIVPIYLSPKRER